MELEIFTERLRLTPLVADDVDLGLALWTDPEVTEYVCDPMTEAEIRQEMPDSIKEAAMGASASGVSRTGQAAKSSAVPSCCLCRSIRMTPTSVL
jgi:hypothetical protein